MVTTKGKLAIALYALKQIKVMKPMHAEAVDSVQRTQYVLNAGDVHTIIDTAILSINQ